MSCHPARLTDRVRSRQAPLHPAEADLDVLHHDLVPRPVVARPERHPVAHTQAKRHCCINSGMGMTNPAEGSLRRQDQRAGSQDGFRLSRRVVPGRSAHGRSFA